MSYAGPHDPGYRAAIERLVADYGPGRVESVASLVYRMIGSEAYGRMYGTVDVVALFRQLLEQGMGYSQASWS